MTDRWHDYFRRAGALGENWLASAVDHWLFTERLRGKLIEYLPVGGRVLEIGCGPGYTGLHLASLGYAFTGVDNEPSLVDRAIETGGRLGLSAQFKVAEASDLQYFYGQFDLAFSVGVLEHFDRDQTIDLLREQARCARIVVIAIPTPWTRYTGKITDEHFYSTRQLKAIVHDAGIRPICTFGFGDITATKTHLATYRLLPRALLRVAQNYGYAYGIAVLGKSLLFMP